MHHLLNLPHPDHMTAQDRLAEVGSILSTAIRRLREKQKAEKIPLDNLPNQWPHGRKTTKGGRR